MTETTHRGSHAELAALTRSVRRAQRKAGLVRRASILGGLLTALVAWVALVDVGRVAMIDALEAGILCGVTVAYLVARQLASRRWRRGPRI